MTIGIYKITNKINGNSYIGMSKNIERRINEHKNLAFNSKRGSDKRKALYQAIRKYGFDNFSLEILEECSEESLKTREIYWIEYYNTYHDRRHYNETPGGDYPGEKTIHKGSSHGMAILTEKEVILCREAYQKGKRSREIYDKFFNTKISYDSFLKMWHGQTWKHIMPEVFNNNPHKGKYTIKD